MARQDSWNPLTKTVQGGMKEGKHASATFTLLGSGPPHLADITDNSNIADSVFPIGLAQDFSWGQTKGVARFYEIGSKRSYVVFGHTAGGVTLTDVYYSGPNIMRKLFAVWQDKDSQQLFTTTSQTAEPNPAYGLPTIAPGYNNYLYNLESDFFDRCFGLFMQIYDNLGNLLVKSYFEEAVTPSYNLGFNAQGVIIQESVTIDYERVMPVDGVDYEDLMQGILDTPY